MEQYWKETRPDQFVILHPTERMPVERAVKITGGKRLAVCARLEEAIPVG